MAVEVFPVIDCTSADTPQFVAAQAELALDCGVDGVFLRNHVYGSNAVVFEAYRLLRSEWAGADIGLNLDTIRLGSAALAGTVAALDQGSLPDVPYGLWYSVVPRDIESARAYQQDTRLRAARLFGGVATYFDPYARFDLDRAVAATTRRAEQLDVVVTTGPSELEVPGSGRITKIYEALQGIRRLAIAAPLGPEDIASRPHDILLATTGRLDARFDAGYLEELVAAAADTQQLSSVS